MIAPAPMKMSVKAPMASATALRAVVTASFPPPARRIDEAY
jgi:hypothetical protein